eukprot:537992-Prorocentrum_minimum.AAC.2
MSYYVILCNIGKCGSPGPGGSVGGLRSRSSAAGHMLAVEISAADTSEGLGVRRGVANAPVSAGGKCGKYDARTTKMR